MRVYQLKANTQLPSYRLLAAMGNSQSSKPTSSHSKPRHTITRQRSAVLSKLSLGCASGNGSILGSDTSHETLSLVNEKATAFREREKDDTQLSQHNYRLREKESYSSLAYSPATDLAQDESTAAYNYFLRAFPEYQLTWILDTLRRTDYSRLERNAETYVDYMGGALYPESLIRVHTSFLNRHILGNTHSVSNR